MVRRLRPVVNTSRDSCISSSRCGELPRDEQGRTMTQNRTSTWVRRTALGLAATAAWGCASGNVTMGHEDLTALKDAPPLKVASYPPPLFAVKDPGNSM